MIASLQSSNKNLQEELRQTKTDLINEIDERQRQIDELESSLKLTREELDALQTAGEQVQASIRKYTALETQYELINTQREVEQRRIRELEDEIAAFGEWKELSKSFHQQVSSIPDLEQEVERLTRDNKNLHETIGNKLQLEEQVYDMQSRLEKSERRNEDQVAIKTQMQIIEQELKEFKAIAVAHCLPNTLITPANLRGRIEQILQKDLILASEKGSSKMDKQNNSAEMQDFKKVCV